MNSATSAYWKTRVPSPRSAPIRQKIGPMRLPGTRARTSAPTVAKASEARVNATAAKPVIPLSAGVACWAPITTSTRVAIATATVASQIFTTRPSATGRLDRAGARRGRSPLRPQRVDGDRRRLALELDRPARHEPVALEQATGGFRDEDGVARPARRLLDP